MSLIFGEALNTETLTFGIHLDYTRSTLTNLDDAEVLGRFNIALLFNYRFNDRFSLQSELFPAYTIGAQNLKPYALDDAGLDAQFQNGKVTRKLTYMGMTALGLYRVYDHIYLELGPQLYLRTKAYDYFTAEPAAGELSLKHNIKEETGQWQSGISTGLCYRLGNGTGMSIGLRYYWGLTDVMKNDPDSQQFRLWQVTGGIPIGRKKKMEKMKAKAEQEQQKN